MFKKTVPISPSGTFWCLNAGQLPDLQLHRERRTGVKAGICGINPESAALSLSLPPFLSARTASWEAHRHSPVRHSQAFLASSSPHYGEMSLSSHLHLCVKPNTHQAAATAATSIYNWPAVWVVRATNYFRSVRQQFFDRYSSRIGANIRTVHRRAKHEPYANIRELSLPRHPH